MNLGVFLAIGESLEDLKSKGQLKRLLHYNIKKFSKDFDRVYIFSYKKESLTIYKNCKVLPNKYGLHRYLYSLSLPIIYRNIIKECDVMRGLQLSGGIPATIAKLLYKRKFIINYGYDYSSLAKIEGKPVQSFFYKVIERPILLLANGVIVTSKEIKGELEKKLPKKLIHLIPNGVDTKLFKGGPPNKNRFLNILFIGRFEKQKNLINLLEALHLSKIKIIGNFYGAGSQKQEIEKTINKLKLKVKVHKPVDYTQIPKILRKADVFALVSKEEGNPKILLEAMSCQKAVLASRVKGIEEIIISGKNGVLTDTSSQGIAKGIRVLSNAKLRFSLGKEARKSIKENFEITKLLEKESNLLKKVANS